MPPIEIMSSEDEKESFESGTSQAESVSCVSVIQPSLTGVVSLTCAPTQKGDSPKSGKQPELATPATEHRATAQEEQEAITEFLQSMPMINREFDIKCKIGEGTFSSVYLASLKGLSEEKVAIKHLVPTSSSSRIENEISCLQTMGGRDHIMSLLTCVRHKDHIALIMPYFKHDKFSDYLHVMSLDEAREYMRALLVALKAVHSHDIIHRDVKPSNFLYNRSTKQFQLVDFGLAHKVKTKTESSTEKPSSRTRTRTSSRGEASSIVAKVNGIAPPSTYSRQLHLRAAARVSRGQPALKSKTVPPRLAAIRGGSVKKGDKNGKAPEGEEVRLCPLRHKASEVCDVCMARSQQVAPRAGTPGFRAPEVLLKSPSQTTAVDMWSAGVIFLCLLSGRYPFFRARDDLSALTQIISLLGSEECSRAANEYGKDLICVPEVPPTDIRSLCTALRRSLTKTHGASNHDNTEHLSPPNKKSRLNKESPKTKKSPHSKSSSSKCAHSVDTSWEQIPDDAFNLLYQFLDFNPLTRITAPQALEHSFLSNQT